MNRKRTLLASFFLLLVARLAGAATLGVVIDRDGKPIEGARISAFRPESSTAEMERRVSGAPDPAAIATAKSDSRGRFSLDLPAESAATIEIAAEGFAPTALRGRAGVDLGAIALEPATPTEIEIRGADGPLPEARVIVGDRTYHSDRTGRVAIPLAAFVPGLTVLHPDYAPLVRPGGPRSAIPKVLQLGKGERIEGIVQRGGNPVANATIFVDRLPLGSTGEDGRFAIERAPAGWRELTAETADAIAVAARTGSTREYELTLRPGGVVSGTVTDGTNRRPLADAVVELHPAGDPFLMGRRPRTRVVADRNGRFEIGPIEGGRYVLRLDHYGYRAPEVQADVRAGERISRALAAAPLATAIGSVLDEEKRPVAGAVVHLDDRPAPGRFRGTRATTWTAPDGRFVLNEIDPGREVLLGARRAGLPPASSDPIRLEAGETKRGITIVLPRGLELRGTVRDPDGNPIAGARIEAEELRDSNPGMIVVRRMMGGEGDAPGTVRTSRDGSFVLRLERGRYNVAADAPGFVPRTLRAVEVTADAEPLAIELTPGVAISGRVVRADGAGVPDVLVAVVSMEMSRREPAITGPDGGFTLEGLPRGTATLSLFKRDEALRDTRVVEAPASNLLIELPPGGTIRGRVVDKGSGQPVPEFSAGPSGERRGRGVAMIGPSALRPFRSDDGSFELRNVPVGTIELLVQAPGYVTARVPNLVVEEGGTLEGIEVALETGTTITGIVTGPDGAPMPDASVSLGGGPGERLPIPQIEGGARAATDANGEYRLEGIAAGEQVIRAAHEGYVPETKSVEVSGREVRVDFRLSRGHEVTGVVATSSGMPVADAQVIAQTAVQDGTGRSARTDSNGVFRFEGLAPGRYSFRASRAGYTTGEVRDVDVSVPAAVRITLETGGAISGRVLGLEEKELVNARVVARGASASASAPVSHDGTFRIEGAPTGTVQLQASVWAHGSARTSLPRTVEVAEGTEAHADLEFASGATIRGRVTREGRPVEGASVSFVPRDRTRTTSGAGRTGMDGEYEVTGLEDGMYEVRVFDMRTLATHETETSVRGSGTFDIRMSGGTLRGVVIDAATSEPLAEVTVTLQSASGSGRVMATSTRTDGGGGFAFDSVSPGSYRLRAEKGGYGHKAIDVTVGSEPPSEVKIRLGSSEGTSLRIVDGRDGRPLQGFVSVADASGRVAWEGSVRAEGKEAHRLPLAPGSYQAIVNAAGYAPAMVALASPGQTRTVALTPGGKLRIESSAPARRLARIVDAAGRPFRRFSWSSPQEIVLDPAGLTIDAIAPGTYTIEVIDGASATRESFTILEGQLTRITI